MGNKKYLFLDVETTGFNYTNSGSFNENELLEVGFILTDENLNTLSENSFVLKAGERERKLMEDANLEMHFKNGLFDECLKSNITSEFVDNYITEILQGLTEKGDKILISGNSVHFDKEVVRRHLPKLYSKLYYRNLDVSSFREALSILNPDVEQIQAKKKFNHRGLDDIRETINELKEYLDRIILNLE